jgi:hypothetical protein
VGNRGLAPSLTLGTLLDSCRIICHWLLMREDPHLELERELWRLREELELEREGRTHNYRERQRLGEELERERLARLGDQRNVQRLERDLQELQQLLEEGQ